MTALLLLLSPLHPVFLETLYLQTAEEAREMARIYKIEVVQKKIMCRKIKKQLANFMWIELGSQYRLNAKFSKYFRHGGVCPGDRSSGYSIASKN